MESIQSTNESIKLRKLVIIPAYNESASIVNTVNDIKKNAPDFDYVVINDHSKDNTLQICKDAGLNVIDLPLNLGIGGAVQTGYLYACQNGYDIAVQFDGDGQHDAKYLNEMAETLVKEQADMVIGSRFIEKEGFQSSFTRRLGIRYFTFLIKILTGQKITDPTSGYRMCNRKIIELFAGNYPKDYPEPETTTWILRKKLKVLEIPVIMRAREEGVSSISLKKSFYYMFKVTMAIIIERTRR
ncbi:glycosyltransferase family 2 protein [Bovifimicola ammoniilytica]|jgi:glycosyltransferase involved in cell wall biosynthesis|uniref:glycosyltransferase family 2 protein n=1 Tax=Bovifimicola ammoniilytica TaxID=2981720 RepID=UPI00033AB28D|nr:glycosyltransferase family 2 protein [Bovifimicola ammoniilytica]MCU6752146.1 glycosyltransferase family 2 protein [Bovifimicola ammoniilytica]CCZ03499.1 glycosyl transferase group 2 family [Eubacterium sp. CAG:603]SCJ09872.1 N-glycosyltransferase [uncultured Eubacterium sp.]